MRELIRLAALVFITGPAAAYAAPILITNSSGQLVGADDILFNGAFYDLDFIESGSCAGEYSGCDESTDFLFDSQELADQFVSILMSDVFQDTTSGNFDTDYTLTSGCALGTSGFCNIYLPYGVGFLGTFSSAVFANYGDESQDAIFSPLSASRNQDFATTPNATLAVVRSSDNPPPTEVPEPGTLALLCVGLAGIGLSRRRKRTA